MLMNPKHQSCQVILQCTKTSFINAFGEIGGVPPGAVPAQAWCSTAQLKGTPVGAAPTSGTNRSRHRQASSGPGQIWRGSRRLVTRAAAEAARASASVSASASGSGAIANSGSPAATRLPRGLSSVCR
jgi:hypothetical protein